ncbi:hypothetical protein I5398_22905 [Citrobacter freundii]|uniref:hypothetical protein n=1 Tax=Citrobacter TaxID=544 RepID=UPI00195D6B75|nr:MULTISPECIES: hypothetical protein [Citrobacter]ELQ2289855.1 hypothetical protein [Escherichia coli]MBJ8798879.1 hypothetical protein [Citrobacter freundii]MDM3082856.1 hypothetical protein [Citrobacter sp. Cf141]MDT7467615.1 hypothetical protein [Citrobacter portucalensis]QRQ77016.1 hypothetical protein JQN59_26720 [Citrobacter sp. B72]
MITDVEYERARNIFDELLNCDPDDVEALAKFDNALAICIEYECQGCGYIPNVKLDWALISSFRASQHKRAARPITGIYDIFDNSRS